MYKDGFRVLAAISMHSPLLIIQSRYIYNAAQVQIFGVDRGARMHMILRSGDKLKVAYNFLGEAEVVSPAVQLSGLEDVWLSCKDGELRRVTLNKMTNHEVHLSDSYVPFDDVFFD